MIYNICMLWCVSLGEIKADESRFTYRSALDWYHYRHPDFEPYFDEPTAPDWPPEGAEVDEDDVNEACGEEFVCRFDFKTTMIRELGIDSLGTQQWSEEMVAMAKPGQFYITLLQPIQHGLLVYMA